MCKTKSLRIHTSCRMLLMWGLICYTAMADYYYYYYYYCYFIINSLDTSAVLILNLKTHSIPFLDNTHKKGTAGRMVVLPL